MITITTATVADIIVTGSFAIPLGGVITIVLLTLLIQKELVIQSSRTWASRLGKILNIGIVPLLLAFAFTALMKIISVVTAAN